MEDFGQLNIKHSESLTSGFLVCENIPLLKKDIGERYSSCTEVHVVFFNCSIKIGYIFTIEGHCSLRIKVVPVCFSCHALIELSFISLIYINIKLWKKTYNLLQQLLAYLKLCKECNR